MSRYSSDSDSSSRRRKGKRRRSRSSSSSDSSHHRRARKSKHHSSYRKSKSYSSRSRRSHSRSNSNSRHSRSLSKDKRYRRSRSRDRYRSKHHHKSRSHSKGHSYKYHSRSSSNDTYSRQSRSPACSNSSSSSGSKKPATSGSTNNPNNLDDQLREKLLKAIKAAESADHQLKQQGVLPKGIKSRNDLSSLPTTKPQGDVIKAIEKDEFVPKSFTSSKSKKANEEEVIVLDTVEDNNHISDVAADSVFHASFFCDPKVKLDRWVKKLYQIRQRAITGEPLVL